MKQPRPETLNPLRLLVVDDSPSILQAYKLILCLPDYDMVSLLDSRAAMERAACEAFNLIVLDGQMPHLNGYELCRRLKADPRTHEVPVLFASGDHDVESKGKAAGAVCCLQKPFGLEALRKAVLLWATPGTVRASAGISPVPVIHSENRGSFSLGRISTRK